MENRPIDIHLKHDVLPDSDFPAMICNCQAVARELPGGGTQLHVWRGTRIGGSMEM